jgi:hypothetical protein
MAGRAITTRLAPIKLAEQLGSRAMRADAIESITCGPVGSVAIIWFLVKEGQEAWAGEECECCS